MKRWIALVALAGMAVAMFVPAQAAGDPQTTPIHVVCKGTGGYDGALWKARGTSSSAEFLSLSHCVQWSPDTAQPPSPPPVVINPDAPDQTFWSLAFWALDTNPVGTGGRLVLEAQGDFFCGEGTLSRANTNNFVSSWVGGLNTWGLHWTATFENGVGAVSGTASHGVVSPHDPAPGEDRTLSGTIVIDDGAAYGQCDDSAGGSEVVAHFMLE